MPWIRRGPRFVAGVATSPLKGLTEDLGLSLGDLLEGIALRALEKTKPSSSRETWLQIDALRQVHELDLIAADRHRRKDRR